MYYGVLELSKPTGKWRLSTASRGLPFPLASLSGKSRKRNFLSGWETATTYQSFPYWELSPHLNTKGALEAEAGWGSASVSQP